MIASGFLPVVCGDFLICESATQPSTIAAMPGSGRKQPSTRPRLPLIIDPIANPCFGVVSGSGGGVVASKTGLIGVPAPGATQPPGIGGCRGSHCVSCSE